MSKVIGVPAFPLYWPELWPRTNRYSRRKSAYKLSFVQARDEVVKNLRLMGARDVIISTNIPLRLDGLPLAGTREPDDPGVAVYWTAKNGDSRVMACDVRPTVRENLRAVAAALEGLRSIERAGATQILERAYAGFKALPANAGRSWRDVLSYGSGTPRKELIEQLFKDQLKTKHPDRGGSSEGFIELCRAREQALSEAVQ